MKIAILGYGAEGRAALKFLKTSHRFKKATFKILDQKISKNYLKNLRAFDFVVRSPGVPYRLKEVQNAIRAGVRFSSVTKLFFEFCPGKIIGITGSKGKGTACTLLHKILKAAKKDAYLAGNIGASPLPLLRKIKKQSIVILELSSFQLQDLEKSPTIAVVLDVFPEHLDHHKNMAEYVEAKSNIAAHQTRNDAVFYFSDNSLSSKIARRSPGRKITITGEPHGLKKNIVMAAAIASFLGVPHGLIAKTIKTFRGLPHRLELVRTIKIKTLGQHTNKLENVGMLFYNDSFGTNPHTLAAAIRHFDKPNSATIVIAGGRGKGLSYAPAGEAAKKSKSLKLAVLIGEDKEKIKKALGGAVKTLYTASLEDAVKKAYAAAKKLINRLTDQPTTVNIVLAPGATSFDMFKSYKERGEKFKAIVKKLKA